MDLVSRQEALARGLKRYFTGNPCKNGHVAERFTGPRGCCECGKAFGAATFAKRYASDPDFRERRNVTASAWKKANRAHATQKNREWHEKNPGKNKEYCNRYYRDNKSKFIENNRRWVAANRERARETIKKWLKAHPESKRAYKHNRRAKIAENGGTFSARDIAIMYDRQKNRCAACIKERKLQIDHIIAVANGGSSDPSNLQLLCGPCNRSKGRKDAMTWAREHGRLL